MNVGVTLNFAGRFDDAIEQLEQALDLEPTFSFAYAMLGLWYLGKGMPERAVAQVEKARALATTRPDVVALHAQALARAGRRRDALKALDDFYNLAKPRGPSPFLVALVHVALGDKDRAFEWLDKAVEARSWELPMLKADPNFDVLRSDPRFPALLARLNLPQ